MGGFHHTAFRLLSPSHGWPHPELTHEKEPVSHRILYVMKCVSMWNSVLAVITGIVWVLQWSCHLLCIFNVQNSWQDNLHL